MTKTKRRILYLSLIIVFLVIAPFLILYASGYNFEFLEKKIIKTGLLVINSEPRGADIYLNQYFSKKRTPERLANLRPGEYTVEVKKTGYQTWQKKLQVFANYSTFADEIVLFKKTPKVDLLLEGNTQIVKSSPEKPILALLTSKGEEKQILIVNSENKTKKIIKENIEAEVKNMEWLENELLVTLNNKNTNDFLIINTDYPEESLLSEITIQRFDKVKQGAYKIYYGLSTDIIYEIDLFDKKIEAVSQRKALDFIAKEQKIFYLSPLDESTELIQFDISQKNEEVIDQLPGQEFEFYNLGEDYFIIKGKDAFRLYKNDNNTPKYTIPNKIIGAHLSQDKKKLLYFNEHELWLYDFEEKEGELLTRFSQEIKEVLFYPGDNYVIYNLNNSIYVIECDGRDVRNNHLLLESRGNVELLDSSKEIITLNIKNDQKLGDGLYNLIIR